MTTIGSMPALAALLRQEVFAFRQRGRVGGATAARAGPAAGAKRAGDLSALVAQRIHGIAATDPDGRRKAVRIFLESVLLEELGAALVRDPRFGEMVDAVQAQMQADRELAPALDRLGEVLLSGRADGPNEKARGVSHGPWI